VKNIVKRMRRQDIETGRRHLKKLKLIKIYKEVLKFNNKKIIS
jgi:hypothetical protein